MRPAISAAAFAIAGSSCAADEPSQSLIVEERVDLCAMAPYSKPLDQVQGTQWRLGVEPGEYVLPDAQPLPGGSTAGADASPMPSLLDVRDVDGARPFDATVEGAVLERSNLSLQPDDARDVLVMWSSLGELLGEPGQWQLSVAIEAETRADFRIDDPRDVWFACRGDMPTGACPSRSFDACDLGGPTVRTRVTLERGEVVLDVRYVERMPDNGDFAHVLFVASEMHVDDVELVQDDFFHLLHSATFPEIGDGSYAVLAPTTLGPAGLGCGIAVVDVGTEQPRAFTVDCRLQALESLAIVSIAREVLP